jgi:GntR family transcriptional regulator
VDSEALTGYYDASGTGAAARRAAVTADALEWGAMFYVRPESGEPIYQQLVRQITHAITTGALKPGDRLPTLRQLAADLVINPNTVGRAYRDLEVAGLIEGGPRRGTFVTFAPPRLVKAERRSRLRPHLDALIAEARVLGFSENELKALLDEALDTRHEGTRSGEGDSP